MQALVHFAVGVFMALLVLSVLDWPASREFLLLFASGFWAMLPDGHWLLHEAGADGPAAAWLAFHRTAYANVFWFHHFIDGIETGRDNVEAAAALGLLVVLVGVYYRFNDWTVE